ncbi:hypothetical protein MMC26_002930 [Xylographa opegraphella]|nr:hypothetical protein [Xylographa opegraphella]
MAQLPYNPTTILSSNRQNSSIVYILRQTDSNSLNPTFLALNTSGTFPSTTLPTVPIPARLPFAVDGKTISFTPLSDDQGNINVYTGQCAEGAEGATLWTFVPDTGRLNGTWHNRNLSTNAIMNSEGTGANYLAAGLMFSTAINGNPDMYVFGGMCPNSTTLNTEDWQASAKYSGTLLEFQSISPSPAGSCPITVGAVSSSGPPIAEAGFTVTPLAPTFFNTSDGDTTQQQNFVLLGGHTQEAFVNLSQVALFSLPQQSWSFLPVDCPSPPAKTDLTARSTYNVEPRSGHTAVLTPDGQRIICFGGWVGDVNTPANPQLAILELGEGYGGNGDWQWAIPDPIGTSIIDGGGLYGHGATMLPGGVMMITGGYTISTDNPSPSRRTDSRLNTATYLFNVSSSTWISTYTNPENQPTSPLTGEPSSGSSATGRKIGLGVGLGVGLALIITLLLVIFFYARRKNSRRAARERDLRELALGAQRFHSSALGLGGFDGRGGNHSAATWMSNSNQNTGDLYPDATNPRGAAFIPDGVGRRGGRSPEAERTGLFVEIPSPTRGLRRSLHSRGAYQPAPWHDDGRRSRGSGHIHPIDERDEYEGDHAGQSQSIVQEVTQRPRSGIFDTAPQLDPFQDPLGSHAAGISRTPSPESPARERERESQGWANDWTIMHQQAGRLSPDKTDRTSSTLSDRSVRSTVSALSVQQSVLSIGRSLSQRSGGLFSSNPFSSSNNATMPSPMSENLERHASVREQLINHQPARSLTLDTARTRPNTAETFVTASTSFAQLQAEGETLLGSQYMHDGASPSRSHSRTKGWMGSMRRAITGGRRSASASPDTGERSTMSSPTKQHHAEVDVPQRAASAGAMLWRKRQGARDWDVEGSGRGTDATGGASDERPDEEEEEWDVESAVERRVVQVMFTVPKERLRVVNAGPDGDGASILSLERASSNENLDLRTRGKQAEGKDTSGKQAEGEDESRDRG